MKDKLFWFSLFACGIGLCILLTNIKPNKKDSRPERADVIQILGCEYILFNNQIIHKGNCTNSIHKAGNNAYRFESVP